MAKKAVSGEMITSYNVLIVAWINTMTNSCQKLVIVEPNACVNKYNNGIPFTPVTANDLKSKYSFNDKDAQRLAIEINEMLEGYIGYTQESEKSTKPEEEIIQSSKHR